MKKIKRATPQKNQFLEKLVDLQLKMTRLPELSPIEKAKLDHALALDQLYYSSRVEGSKLTKEMLDTAIHGQELSKA